MSDNEKALDKVKKLLAKATGTDNEHEVEIFSLKAQQILAQYNLCMDDVGNIFEPKKKEVLRDKVTDTSKKSWWIRNVCRVIAKNFRCESIITTTGKNKEYLSLVGLKDDVLIAKEVLAFTIESIDILSNNYIVRICDDYNSMKFEDRPVEFRKYNTLKDFEPSRNDYINGFIKGLEDKYKEQVEREGWGLILAKDNAVITKLESMRLGTAKPVSASFGYNSEHYGKGYKDGKTCDHKANLLK